MNSPRQLKRTRIIPHLRLDVVLGGGVVVEPLDVDLAVEVADLQQDFIKVSTEIIYLDRSHKKR